jgi:hypothetical protein
LVAGMAFVVTGALVPVAVVSVPELLHPATTKTNNIAHRTIFVIFILLSFLSSFCLYNSISRGRTFVRHRAFPAQPGIQPSRDAADNPLTLFPFPYPPGPLTQAPPIWNHVRTG